MFDINGYLTLDGLKINFIERNDNSIFTILVTNREGRNRFYDFSKVIIPININKIFLNTFSVAYI